MSSLKITFIQGNDGATLQTMVISHTHKYLFIEIPRTASCAIRRELVRNYSGERILFQHANYNDLPNDTRKSIRNYVVFAGVRNPLDDAASSYQKLKNNHGNAYTDQSQWIEHGGWVTPRLRRLFKVVHTPGITFAVFLRKAFPYSYSSRVCANKKYCNNFIRLESVQSDFDSVLKSIGIEKQRDIPLRNVTQEKKPYMQYYAESADAREYAARTFGPFMEEWGYIHSNPDLLIHVRKIDFLKYEIYKNLMIAYFNYFKKMPSF